MKKIICLFFLPLLAMAQHADFRTEEVKVNELVAGTLYSPQNAKKPPLLILLAGSGPTDRNGNQPGVHNNSLKMIAESAAKSGIAVFSYDKRILAQMKNGTLDEKNLSFEDFIDDAKQTISFFKLKKSYSKIVVGGHSEGSLIGMVAANGNADGFISISGGGRSIDKIITDQVVRQAPMMKDEIEQNFAVLKSGKTFKLENPMLSSLFRESAQPYLISWIKYDPVVEIAKLKVPVLIVNGTKDLQVPDSEAQLLKAAKPDSKIVIIENMNHVLKVIAGDETENAAAYNNPDLPVSETLTTAVNQFIKTI
ncbi:alpha/beta hydrolase [Flavobacterium selenitireducens]|uniref:alpha/beta hydrolase n=1 Tax=Flavobacterium selenitireducens TaxID=2722704 RepID=UPI00168A6D3A|nr:alpha/beta hydrolase [Flavobacterium selenitireducens]MBD3582409.1 alpha/beta hydrolase [Flavobacterium selenitireducens]